jgi:hypothetical protein
MSLTEMIANKLIKKGSHPRPLGRTATEDTSHFKTYSIEPLLETIKPTPMAIGINWYENFDTPKLDSKGRWWIGVDSSFRPTKNLGSIRGGHCVAVKCSTYSDLLTWWDFYDQGNEGACVGFGSSRMMSMLNRKRYDARWLWDWAKKKDEWPDTNPGDDNGTSVHAGADVLRTMGHVPYVRTYTDYRTRDTQTPVYAEGITAVRWATTVEQMEAVLQSPLHNTLQATPILNSWGRYYPHLTWIPWPVMQRLIDEDGEVAIPTDR